MDKAFVLEHIDEVVDALNQLDDSLCNGLDKLKARAMEGVMEINSAMVFCMDNTDKADKIPFSVGCTNDMIYDYNLLLNSCGKVGKLLGTP